MANVKMEAAMLQAMEAYNDITKDMNNLEDEVKRLKKENDDLRANVKAAEVAGSNPAIDLVESVQKDNVFLIKKLKEIKSQYTYDKCYDIATAALEGK